MLACVLFSTLHAQKDSIVEFTVYDTVSTIVHFAKDKYSLSDTEKQNLSEFLGKINVQACLEAWLSGHTDSDASDAYNERLAENRCASVMHFLRQSSTSLPEMKIEAWGERRLLREELTKEDQALNRRVELTFVTARRDTKILICGGTYKTCPDTVWLPQGSFYLRDTCMFPKDKGCAKITEYITPGSAREAGLRTEDANGIPLQSAGMLKYDICEGRKIEVFIPLPDNCFTPPMYLYEMDSRGRWKRVGSTPLPVVTIRGQQFLRTVLSGMGTVNCDDVFFAPPRSPKVIFKAKDGLKLEEVVWSCDCPFTIQTGRPTRRSGKKIVIDRTCCPELKVSVSARTEQGEQLKLDYVDIDSLKHGKSIFGCKSEERKRWFIFKIRKKMVYRRYKIRRSDFP
jgi:hypothetical protein